MIVVPRPIRPLWLLAVVAIGPGCARTGDGAPVIATAWPEAERRSLEADFRGWGGAVSIAWVGLESGDDLAQVVDRRGVDVVLGGPAASYRRLDAAGRWEPIGPAGGP